MARPKNTEILSVVHPICCGLDVHKNSISACLLVQDPSGEVHEEIKEFKTFTLQLLELKTWLADRQCPIVAIESTGVYWQPVHNVMEESVHVVLVNARHVKNVPGRKTDISDSKWLAGLLRHGLLRGSFIPPKQVRQWRQLWTLRTSYVETMGDFKRRVHKHLQSANVKIDSVAATLFSMTGRNLMNLLISKKEAVTLKEVEQCAKGGLKEKVRELSLSIQGFLSDHDRYILAFLLDTVQTLEDKINQITLRLKTMMRDHEQVAKRLDQIPGVDEIGACGILSITGPDLSAFPSPEHFCSWAGLCPGNNQSAGKRKSGKSPVQKHPLRSLLVELAWGAIKKKNSYYREKFFRLRSRIGAKPAICAIAHRMAKAIYHVIKNKENFIELGNQYLDQLNRQAKLKRLRSQAMKLGFSLVPVTTS